MTDTQPQMPVKECLDPHRRCRANDKPGQAPCDVCKYAFEAETLRAELQSLRDDRFFSCGIDHGALWTHGHSAGISDEQTRLRRGFASAPEWIHRDDVVRRLEGKPTTVADLPA